MDALVIVKYTFTDGASQVDVVTPGLGRDSADKAVNKAMTAAYKYALIQLLMVSDKNDDSDGATYEETTPSPAVAAVTAGKPLEGWLSMQDQQQAHNELAERIRNLSTDDARATCRTWRAEHGWPVPAAELDELKGVVTVLEVGGE
jgi:hypothetical protein